MSKKDTEDTIRNVRIAVFLSEAERKAFKLKCVKEDTNMSAKAHELITQWINQSD